MTTLELVSSKPSLYVINDGISKVGSELQITRKKKEDSESVKQILNEMNKMDRAEKCKKM